jgi:replicative DNA helicase
MEIKMSEAHAAVLGSMILDNECIAEVADRLTADMLPDHRLAQIWDAIMALDADSSTIDLLTLRDKLGKDKVEAMGGVEFLVRVAESVPSAASVMYYSDIVLETYRCAEMTRLGEDIVRIASGKETATEKAVLADKAHRIRTEFDVKDSSRVMHAREVEVSFEVDDIKYLKTQFPELNAQIMGFGSTALVGVLGSTGMGKTSLMIDFLLHFGYHEEIPCAMFSCELTNEENMQRMCCNLADENFVSVVNGFCNSDSKDNLYQKAAELHTKPIFLNKTPGLNPTDLRRKLTSLHRREGIQIAFVDHLHNMKMDKKSEGRLHDLAYMVKEVKNLAVELEIPIVLGMQANRKCAIEKRAPTIYEVRDCGEVEESCDRVLIPFRPARFGMDGQDTITEGKGRNCATGPIKVEFFEHYSSFRNPSY